jgi:peptide/nickel transport system substrate-binding protein
MVVNTGNLKSKKAITKMQAVVIAVIIIVAAFGAAYYLSRPAQVTPASERLIRWDTALIGYRSIDPAVSSDEQSTAQFIDLYDTLVYPAALTGESKPYLAQSWEVTEDGLTWTFHLRQRVKFHDGSELTAEDVKFSMDRLVAIGEGYAYLFITFVENTTVLDKYTVQFKLKQPLGPFLSILVRLFVLNKDVVMANIEKPGPYGDNGDYATKWLSDHEVGSGPYKLKEINKGAYMSFERFKDWWGEYAANAPDKVITYVVSEPATIRTMMARRELEFTDDSQSNEFYRSLGEIKGVNLGREDIGSQEFYFMINTKKPPTDDVHFRKAMAWAMDYETVANSIYPGCTQSAGPVPQRLPGHDPSVFQYHQDLAKAREELALSKYADNYTLYTVEIHWCTEMGSPYESTATLFAKSMADIGINVKVVSAPWLSVIDEMSKLETSPHVEMLYIAANYAEAGSILESRYHSKSTGTYNQNEWLLNSTIDAMIEDSLRTINETERLKKYYAIQEEIMKLCPSIFLVDIAFFRGYQSYYVDWPAATGESNPVMGYIWEWRLISVYPEKRDELLKS